MLNLNLTVASVSRDWFIPCCHNLFQKQVASVVLAICSTYLKSYLTGVHSCKTPVETILGDSWDFGVAGSMEEAPLVVLVTIFFFPFLPF